MQLINKKTGFIVFLSLMCFVVFAQSTQNESLSFEILLSKRTLVEMNIDDKFINFVEVTSKRHVLISTNNQFYLLGWGGLVPVGNKLSNKINSFAYSSEGFLFFIHNDELCTFDSIGNASKLYNLPKQTKGIAKGKYAMYLYDNDITKTNHILFIITKGGRYEKLLTFPTTIESVIEADKSVIFASGNAVYKYDLMSHKIKSLASLPQNNKVISLTLDSLHNRMFFSTDSMIFSFKDSTIVLLTNKIGGTLKYYNNGLIVFDTKQQLLTRIVGIEQIISTAIQSLKKDNKIIQTSESLSNASIIKMVSNKMPDDVIIKTIESSVVNFDLSIDNMVNLSNQGVSSAVIRAMKIAMRKQSAPTK